MDSNINKTPKGISLRESMSIERKNLPTGLICRRVPKEGIKKLSLYFTHMPRSPPMGAFAPNLVLG